MKREHDFSTILTVLKSDPRRKCNTRKTATGATTSMMTRDWDPPIDQRKGLPTMQMLIDRAKQVRRKEGEVIVKPHTTMLPKQHKDQKSI